MGSAITPIEILLVDDEPGIRDGLGDLLAAEGHGVRTANGAEAALVALRRRPADLLITDLRMDGPDGLELIRSAREFLPDIDAIVVTGYASLDNAVSAAKLHLLDFIEKPFRVAQVLSAVARCQPNRPLPSDSVDHPNLPLDPAAPSAVAAEAGQRLIGVGCTPSVAAEFEAAIAEAVRNAVDQDDTGRGRVGWGVHRESDAAVVSLRLPLGIDLADLHGRRVVALFIDDVAVEALPDATIVTFRRHNVRAHEVRGHRMSVLDAEAGLVEFAAWIAESAENIPLRIDLGDCAALSSTALLALESHIGQARDAGRLVEIRHASAAVARAAEALALHGIAGPTAAPNHVARRALWS